jgi:ribonuclease HI
VHDNCNLIVKILWKKSPLISCIKEQLEETKVAGKHVKIHWIPAHRAITGNEKADELAKRSIRHSRNIQISIPAEDMKIIWRKKSKQESQLWHQEAGWVRGQQYFMFAP